MIDRGEEEKRMKDKNFSYGKRLKELIEDKRTSVYAIAMKSGVSYNTVKNIVNENTHYPRHDTVKLLIAALEISSFEFYKDYEMVRTVEDENEIRLINLYRKLSVREQGQLEGYALALSEKCEEK